MTVLPIVEREMRVASRRPETYWSRLAGPAITMIIMALMIFTIVTVPARLLGYEIFQFAFFFNFIFCLFAGLQLTADCVSSEKRDGTLGFLFLTDLKGFDVILGKLAVTSLRGFYGLLAVVPVMAVPMLMGGVSMAEVARAGLALVNTMLFSLSAGILISVLNTDARRSGAFTFVLIMGITAGFPGLGAIFAMRYHLDVLDDLLPFFVASPGFSCFLAMDRLGTMANRYWWSYGVVFMWSCVFLSLASRLVMRSWQDRPASAWRARWRERWQGWLQGRAMVRASYRRGLLNINPMLWLACRNRLKQYYLWLFLGGVGAVWLWGFVMLGREWLPFSVGLLFVWLFHSVLKLGLATEAGERFSLDLRSGALELILSTRTSVGELLKGQLLALSRHFMRAAVVIIVLDLLLLIAGAIFRGDDMDLSDQFQMGLTLVLGVFVFVADMVTLSWVGMWQGIASKDHKRAAGETIARVLLLPWGGVLLVDGTVSFIQWWFNFPNLEIPFLLQLGMWFSFSIAADIAFTVWARGRLYAEFRLRVMRRYWPEPPHQFWALLGRKCGEVYRTVTGWFRAGG